MAAAMLGTAEAMALLERIGFEPEDAAAALGFAQENGAYQSPRVVILGDDDAQAFMVYTDDRRAR